MSSFLQLSKLYSLGAPAKNPILCCEFHPSGMFLLSALENGEIQFYGAENESLPRFYEKHSGAINEVHFFNDGSSIYSCSEDETISIWDTFVGTRRSTLRGHTCGVNSVQASRVDCQVLCSGSKDGTVRIWDIRQRECAASLDADPEVTATVFSECGEFIFSGGLEKDIKIWDIRMFEVISKLEAHLTVIKSLALSPCGAYLLSHSLDNSLCIWDVRPFCVYDKFIRRIISNQCYTNGLMRCAWSPDGSMISAATSNSLVNVWNSLTGKLLYELPANKGRVNAVAFHPKKPVLLTASNTNYHFSHDLTSIKQVM